MIDSNKLRVGVFERVKAADRAVAALIEAGFPPDSISVVCPTCSVDEFEGTHRVEPSGAHTRGAAATGGAIGAVLGGFSMALAAATGGAGLLVAGPLLLGAAGGGVAGGFIGAMTTRGLEPEIADFYDQALQSGQVLVAVESAGEGDVPPASEADRILTESGARSFELPPG